MTQKQQRHWKDHYNKFLAQVSQILCDEYGWHLGDLPDYKWAELSRSKVDPEAAVKLFLKDWCNATRIQNFYGQKWWDTQDIRVTETGARMITEEV